MYTTFVTFDFYDFETQATPLIPGTQPGYNYSSTFKLRVDNQLMRYLALDSLVFEVHAAQQTSYEMIGKSTVLLRGKNIIFETIETNFLYFFFAYYYFFILTSREGKGRRGKCDWFIGEGCQPFVRIKILFLGSTKTASLFFE